MAATEQLTLEEVRRKGIDALTQALGVSDMIRFLQSFDNGQGDYTAERRDLLGNATISEVVAEIKRIRKPGGFPREGLADRSKHTE